MEPNETPQLRELSDDQLSAELTSAYLAFRKAADVDTVTSDTLPDLYRLYGRIWRIRDEQQDRRAST